MPWSFGIGALFYLQKSWNTARRYAIIKELPNLQQKGGAAKWKNFSSLFLFPF